MSGLPGWVRGCACLVLSLCACGPEPPVVDYGCADLASGSLVITEVHANPEGADGDGEYVEVFNPGMDPVVLLGITLTASRSDGEATKTHRIGGGSVASESYFVLGNASRAQHPDYLDYSYDSGLGNLRNSDGRISLWCGEELIDQITYSRTTDGRALELDGELAPHHTTNDDPGAWCVTPEGAGALGDGNFGTPGRRNTPCNQPPTDGTCREGSSIRLVNAPRPDDLRITEWMPDPAGLDTGREWVELQFVADVDLNGLELGPAADELRSVVVQDLCFPVEAGSAVVFGASPAAAPRVDAELPFTLRNSGDRSIAAGFGGVLLDIVRYDHAIEGVAWQVDEDGTACLAELSPGYDEAGNLGTPSEPNPKCRVELEPGTCFAEDGVPRRIVRLGVGQALITEWMADPAAVDNRSGEWIELFIGAAADLNGLTLTDFAENTMTIESETCLTVEAGTRLLFVRSLDATVNGGIGAATGELTLSLNNRDETITLSVGEEVLDSIQYVRSDRGVATQVDEQGMHCAASTPYGDGDFGTPGRPNPACG